MEVATSRQRWRVPRLKVAKAIMSAFLPSCAISASRGFRFDARSATTAALVSAFVSPLFATRAIVSTAFS